VIGGLEQWQEVLIGLSARPERSLDPSSERSDADEEKGLAAQVPVGTAAQELSGKFDRFLRRLTPPSGECSYRTFVGWLERLIGPDPTLQPARAPSPDEPTALQAVARAREAAPALAERDVAALEALKDVLRGLVWAEEALGTPPISFPRFFEELAGAVEAAAYRLPVHPDREEILVADVLQARGVPFRAVAVLGLAEGVFPAVLREDLLLRDADRLALQEDGDWSLGLAVESAEAEFFYETVTRPRERLLLTRPRLSETGVSWQASPFWEEVRRLVAVEPQRLTSESVPAPAEVASWAELMESLASFSTCTALREWVRETKPQQEAAAEAAAAVFDLRARSDPESPFDGCLHALAADFQQQFAPSFLWSASRLESYRTCPFFFFVSKVLGLEPRQEPTEGLDARQLGNIYHHIFESVYQHPRVTDPADVGQLLDALSLVAGPILDRAPRQEGFRETAWWQQTREEIVDDVRRSLEALAAGQGEFVPYRHEAPFGLAGYPPLVVGGEGGGFRLRGWIDRVDRTPDGRVRVIDYKTAGPHAFTRQAIAQGKKLQLPLYALAARDALQLGQPVDGFYWHVRHAEPSPFTLKGYEGGSQAALETALQYAQAAVCSARQGHFVPQAPQEGCPSYCPARGFCWHYEQGFGG